MAVDFSRWPELSRLLDEALELPEGEARERWLESLGPEHEACKPALRELLSTNPGALDTLVGRVVGGGIQPGATIGGYRLLRELGSGGMGVVWLAAPPGDGSLPPVALKLPALSLHGPAFLERFARERDILANLEHPHIAGFIEAGVDPSGQQFLAMEYVEGRPLTAYCDERGLSLEARARLFLQVLDAVQHAHERNVLHRDLKPANILVTAEGHCVLLDFGVAKILDEGEAKETALTQVLGRALTPDYASPEQVRGGTVSAPTDVYALGVIFYELVCGARPYRLAGNSRREVEDAIVGAKPAPPSLNVNADSSVAKAEGGRRALAGALRGDWDTIALAALRKNPEDRYASVRAFAEDIERRLRREPIAARREGEAAGAAGLVRRLRVVPALAIVLLVALSTLREGHRAASDLGMLFARPLPPAQQVALVSIGPEDYRRHFGSRSPLDAAVLERLVRQVLAGKPAVLGVDIDTSDPSFARLRESFAAVPPGALVWAEGADGARGIGAKPRPQGVLGGSAAGDFAGAALALSLADADDGVVRRYAQAIETEGGERPTFYAALGRAGRGPDAPAPDTQARVIRFTPTTRLDLPASVVLSEGFDWQGRIEGRVVLLGGRYDRADLHRTPLGSLQGIDIVANAVETEMRGAGRPPPPPWKILLVGALELAGIIVLFDRLGFVKGLGASIAGAVLFATLLATTGLFTEWPYAILALLLILANQVLLEIFRRQRAAINAAWSAIEERFRYWRP